jgi:hypothetical protein
MIQVLAGERHALLAICDYFYHRGMPVKPEALNGERRFGGLAYELLIRHNNYS